MHRNRRFTHLGSRRIQGCTKGTVHGGDASESPAMNHRSPTRRVVWGREIELQTHHDPKEKNHLGTRAGVNGAAGRNFEETTLAEMLVAGCHAS
ncbi:hypothetical protein TB1_043353 [Malus domestica]